MLRAADLRDAVLRDASLRYARLPHAKLDGADLRNCDLEQADVHRASREGWKTRGANKKNLNDTDDELARAEDFVPKAPPVEEGADA